MVRRFMVPVAIGMMAAGPMAVDASASAATPAMADPSPIQQATLPFERFAPLIAALPADHNPHSPPGHGPLPTTVPPPTTAPPTTAPPATPPPPTTTAPPSTTAPPVTTRPPQTLAPIVVTAPPPTVRVSPGPVQTIPAGAGTPNAPLIPDPLRDSVRSDLAQVLAGAITEGSGPPLQEPAASGPAGEGSPEPGHEPVLPVELPAGTSTDPIGSTTSPAARPTGLAPGAAGGAVGGGSRQSELLGRLIVLFGIFVALCAVGKALWRPKVRAIFLPKRSAEPTEVSDL
jgi:hypothetical protein